MAVAAATSITAGVLYAFGPKPNAIIFFSYLLAILIAAWCGGYGPGLFAVALSHFVAPYFLIPGFNPFRTDINRIVLSAGVAAVTSRVAATRRQTEADLRTNNEVLEHRVAERTAELRQAKEAVEALAAELQQANHDLRRSNADLERFAYIASHDLQEPLRMIGAYAQMLSQRYRGRLDTDADEMIGYVVDGVKRMRDLVNGVLDFSHAAGDAPILQAVDAGDALAAAKANLLLAIMESNAVVHAEQLPIVTADVRQLALVFQNLISNSLRYRRKEQPVISISASRAERFWRFSVTDNGIGIASQHTEHVFQLFRRLHAWSKLPGCGIGLPICKRIVEHHGGSIWVDSVEGAGSTFHFTLPAADNDYSRSDKTDTLSHQSVAVGSNKTR